MIDRIKAWIIHKLGGLTMDDHVRTIKAAPHIDHTRLVNTICVSVGFPYPKHPPKEVIKRELIRRLTCAVIDHTLVEKHELPNNSVQYTASIHVVKPWYSKEDEI